MPGLNAIISFDEHFVNRQNDIDDILKTMDYDQAYSHSAIIDSPQVQIYFSGYAGYPQYKATIGDKTLVIEGAIYNKTYEQVKEELCTMLPSIADGTGKTDALRDFMFDTDGEFIVYYIDNAASRAVIFNDAMGRLPAYCYADSGKFVLGRALKFVVGNLSSAPVDDFALIEYFLFSAALGDRTVFKNICRLMPCSLYVIDYGTGKCEKRTIHKYNFDDRWDDRPPAEYVARLHDLFLESTLNRADRFKDRKQILSLSGGLDSRTNLMALRKCNVDFETMTYIDYYNLLGRDLPVVDELIKIYGIKNKLFRLIEENIPDMERMVFLKDGTGLMGTMGSVLNSMEVIEKEYGRNIVFYVGDEGNYTTAPRYGGGKIGSIEELVRQIFLKNSLSVYSIEEVAKLFGKSPKAIRDYLCDYFSQYPEKDNVHKVDHFFIWERSFKFTMENQDRVRLFFWPLAPHYGIKYAPYAFKIKNEYLVGWKIYAALLRALDTRSVSIKYANFGIPLDSPLLPIYLPLRALATGNETIRRNLLMILRLLKNPLSIGRKTKEFSYINELRTYLADLTGRDKAIGSILDTDYLNDLLGHEKYTYRMYVAANIVKYLDDIGDKLK
jgi:hypothetical protein